MINLRQKYQSLLELCVFLAFVLKEMKSSQPIQKQDAFLQKSHCFRTEPIDEIRLPIFNLGPQADKLRLLAYQKLFLHRSYLLVFVVESLKSVL